MLIKVKKIVEYNEIDNIDNMIVPTILYSGKYKWIITIATSKIVATIISNQLNLIASQIVYFDSNFGVIINFAFFPNKDKIKVLIEQTIVEVYNKAQNKI